LQKTAENITVKHLVISENSAVFSRPY